MSNQEEEYLRAERQRKKNLQHFISNQQRFSSNQGHVFNGKQLTSNRKASYPFDNDQNDGPRQGNQRYLPIVSQNRKSYDYDEVNRDRFEREAEDDKTEVYLKNCEQIIKNLRELKQKKRSLGERRLMTEPYSPKGQRSQVYGNKANSSFSSHGKPYNKVLPPLEDYRTPIARSKQYGAESSKKSSRKGSQIYYVRTKSQSRSSQRIKSFSLPVAKDSKKEGGQQSEKSPQLPEQEPVSESLSKVQQSRKKPQQSTIEAQQIKQKQQFYECITQLTKFLKQQNNSRIQAHQQQQNKENSLGKPSESRMAASQQSSIHARSNHEQKREEIEPEMEVIPSTHSQETQKNKEKEDKEQKQKFANLIETTINALRQLKDRNNQQPLKSSRKGSRVISNAPLSKIKQIQKTKEETIQSHKDDHIWPLIEKGGKQISENVNDKKNQLLEMLMKHIEMQDHKNGQLAFCLKELTSYLRDQNHQFEEVINSREKPREQIKQEHLKSNQQKVEEVVSPEIKLVQPYISDIQTNKEVVDQSPQESQKVEQKKPENSRSKPEQKQAMDESSPRVKNAVIKNLKKARLRGSMFSEKLTTFKKQHQKMNYYISGKSQSTRINEAIQNEKSQPPIITSDVAPSN